MIRAGTSCAADDHSAALRERSRRNTHSATPHRPASEVPGPIVLHQHTPFTAAVSDEAGPNTTGATAGHVDETDLLDSSVPLDSWTPEEDYPTRTSRRASMGWR